MEHLNSSKTRSFLHLHCPSPTSPGGLFTTPTPRSPEPQEGAARTKVRGNHPELQATRTHLAWRFSNVLEHWAVNCPSGSQANHSFSGTRDSRGLYGLVELEPLGLPATSWELPGTLDALGVFNHRNRFQVKSWPEIERSAERFSRDEQIHGPICRFHHAHPRGLAAVWVPHGLGVAAPVAQARDPWADPRDLS